MTADTFTSRLGSLKQGTGNNEDLWGDLFNDDVLDVLERGITGLNAFSATSGAVNLASVVPPSGISSAVDAIQYLTAGTQSGTVTITVPDIVKSWIFFNNLSGPAYGCLVKTPSGSAINLPRQRPVLVMCDGSGVVVRDDRHRVGNGFDHYGTTCPPDAFECDGSLLLIADFPSLFAKIGVTWGGNGTTTFGLPNLYDVGRYTRSRTASLAIGTYQVDVLGTHNHTAAATHSLSVSGTTGTQSADHTHTGSGTTSSDGAHTHSVPTATDVGGTQQPPRSSAGTPGANSTPTSSDGGHTHTYSFTTSGISASHTHTFSATVTGSIAVTTTFTGDTETRPKTAVVMKCIRY